MKHTARWITGLLVAATIALVVCSCAASDAGALDYDETIEPSDALSGRTVVIDPGHGNSESYIENFSEGLNNLVYALELREKLEAQGAKVIMTRETEANVENYQRMAKLHIYTLGLIKDELSKQLLCDISESERQSIGFDINELTKLQGDMELVLDDADNAKLFFNSPYDTTYSTQIKSVLREIFEYEEHQLVRQNMLYISIHSNASGTFEDTETNGTITYFLSNSCKYIRNYYTNYKNGDLSERIAELTVDRVSAAGSFKNRGTAQNDYFMLREHNLPAVLIEIAYHSNPSDREKLVDPYYRNRITNAITLSVLSYFEKLELYESK